MLLAAGKSSNFDLKHLAASSAKRMHDGIWFENPNEEVIAFGYSKSVVSLLRYFIPIQSIPISIVLI